ncbi:MAG: sensor protein [Myxococcaceae bacterium]|nr:sensor protein [Myxococcaceae bacterium]
MSADELRTVHDFSLLLDALIEGLQVLDFDMRYVLVNRAAAEHGRTSAERLLGRTITECYPGIEQTELFGHMRRCLAQRESHVLDNEFTYSDGTSAHFELRIEPVPQGICVLSVDVSARRQAEAALRITEDRLRHSERMETVGMLAAGIAHDFSNLLSVMLGFGEKALTREGGPQAADVEGMMAAARRSADLTRQLLAFGRRQVMHREVIDPVALVTNLESMLQRTIGPDVELELQVTLPVGRVEVDPGKLEQVVMNLVLNARDAIATRGKITIGLCELDIEERYAREHPGTSAGRQVMLSVSDTGSGMDAATQARIFEPFYTTKAHGKGTGLGLATVYGIVKQSGGNIWVYSELGRGTTFKVYLPRSEHKPRSMMPKSLAPKPPARSEQALTVLVAEDDALLRLLADHALTAAGYRVRVAASGDEALALCQSDPSISMLITDVVMPGLRGPELIALARKVRPDLKVLCTSGYALSALKEQEAMPEEVAFLEKPYLPSLLVRTVRQLMEQ